MRVFDWRFITLLMSLVVAWGFVYQDSLLSMMAIWSRSDTFAHGYFILPISLWLLWRDKAYLSTAVAQTAWLPLPLLLLTLLVALFAQAADINVLTQLAAVLSFILIIWMMLGHQLSWRYKFPLAYLLFAVPMGEGLIPLLQDVTAWITVFLLKLHGIPVFRDGLYIQVPTGMFEVAVACSGIRYLIASAAVGTLFAYLSYSQTKKQIIFILFSIVMPILANGVRAYGIVIIAHYSNMTYATGADHLVYGWLFFGLVIMLNFYIGGKFADHFVTSSNDCKNEQLLQQVLAKHPSWLRHYMPLFAVTLCCFLLTWQLNRLIPTFTPNTVASASLITDDFHKVPHSSSWGIHYEDAMQLSHFSGATGVEYFRAVYANKQTQGELVSWQNKLHDHDNWTIVETRILMVKQQPVQLMHLRDIQGKVRSYLYCYLVGRYQTVSGARAKVMQAWHSLSRQSDYSEIRAVSVVNELDQHQAEVKLLAAFVQLSSMEL